MQILGAGIVFSRGVGLESLDEALRQGWQPPSELECKGTVRQAFRVDLDAVPDRTLLKKIRRADRFSKMAVLAAADAVRDSGLADVAGNRTGIILSTAFGAHVTTFEFLDGILDYGDTAVSPTTFSNSVHNAAASYISSTLGIQGPTLTVTQFRFSFQSALQLASAWLAQGRCDRVLVGAVEQYGDVLGYVAEQKLPMAADGRIRPFALNSSGCLPGEGAVFCLVGREDSGSHCCKVEATAAGDNPFSGSEPCINIIDADGMLQDESAYLSSIAGTAPVAAYSPIFGSMMVGGAFNMAAALLMLKNQTTYTSPVQDNPHGLNIITQTALADIRSIRCIGCNCYGEKSYISLSSG